MWVVVIYILPSTIKTLVIRLCYVLYKGLAAVNINLY